MRHRHLLLSAAILGVLAATAFAQEGSLSLRPVVFADDTAPQQPPLMSVLDRAGMARPLSDAGLNIYGWVEGGYTYNHRHHTSVLPPSAAPTPLPILPGPFNHEVGNHFMLNQVDLRIERQVDSTKFDVGGLVEVLYGTDAGFIHSSGLGFNGNDPSDNHVPGDPLPDKYRANYQFDIPQAYVDVNIPIGNGLKIRTGKFETLFGYEHIDPTQNQFYSHSWVWSAFPYTNTGILGMYELNDQWAFSAGISRGWDQSLEDSGPDGGLCAIDALGRIQYKPTKSVTATLNWSVGPENYGETSHYRTAIDPIVEWQVTDRLKLAAEGLYIADGGMNGNVINTGISHAYGDVWGAALYAGYSVNEYLTLNGRIEKFDSLSQNVLNNSAVGALASLGLDSTNVYSATLGVTITPLPRDPIGKNLTIRPEIRYDCSEDHIFQVSSDKSFRDQLTFAADIVFKF